MARRRAGGARSPRRNELLHALREAQEAPMNDTAAWARLRCGAGWWGCSAAGVWRQMRCGTTVATRQVLLWRRERESEPVRR